MVMKYSKEQKDLFAYYESHLPLFTLKKIFARKCVLTVTKPEKTKGGHYYIDVKGHPVDKTFYYSTATSFRFLYLRHCQDAFPNKHFLREKEMR